MTWEFIGFFVLVGINMCLCVWILFLDNRVEQMKGYIKRVERENEQLRLANRRRSKR